jgi:putative transposase
MQGKASEVCRQLGVSEPTFCAWKRKYAGVGVPEVREPRQLREENRKLKQLMADLTLDKHILQEVLSKKGLKPAGRQELVKWPVESFELSERHACGLIQIQ